MLLLKSEKLISLLQYWTDKDFDKDFVSERMATAFTMSLKPLRGVIIKLIVYFSKTTFSSWTFTMEL